MAATETPSGEWSLYEHSGTFWNGLEHSGTVQNILEHSGTVWNILEHSGTVQIAYCERISDWNSDRHTDRQKTLGLVELRLRS